MWIRPKEFAMEPVSSSKLQEVLAGLSIVFGGWLVGIGCESGVGAPGPWGYSGGADTNATDPTPPDVTDFGTSDLKELDTSRVSCRPVEFVLRNGSDSPVWFEKAWNNADTDRACTAKIARLTLFSRQTGDLLAPKPSCGEDCTCRALRENPHRCTCTYGCTGQLAPIAHAPREERTKTYRQRVETLGV